MTTNINIQNKTLLPEQAAPVLKTVVRQSKDIKQEQNNVQSIDPAKATETNTTSTINKVEESSKQKEPSEQALDNAVKQLNSYVQSVNRNLEFNIDEDNGRTVVKVTDAKTDELIRQIPNEEALHIAKQLDDQLNEDNTDVSIFLIKERA